MSLLELFDHEKNPAQVLYCCVLKCYLLLQLLGAWLLWHGYGYNHLSIVSLLHATLYLKHSF